MLIIMHKNPEKAAQMLPNSIKFKQLLELAQMISTITGSVYKPVKQGKVIREWINKNRFWVAKYYSILFVWCCYNINMKQKTVEDLKTIIKSLKCTNTNENITTAILRYVKGYECKYPTDTELPIDIVISEYAKYVEWKGWE